MVFYRAQRTEILYLRKFESGNQAFTGCLDQEMHRRLSLKGQPIFLEFGSDFKLGYFTIYFEQGKEDFNPFPG